MRTDKTMTAAKKQTAGSRIQNPDHGSWRTYSSFFAKSAVKKIVSKFESEVRTNMGGVFGRSDNLTRMALIAVLALVMVFGTIGAADAAFDITETFDGLYGAASGGGDNPINTGTWQSQNNDGGLDAWCGINDATPSGGGVDTGGGAGAPSTDSSYVYLEGSASNQTPTNCVKGITATSVNYFQTVNVYDAGTQSIYMTFDYNDNCGAGSLQVQYSVDGGGWTNIGSAVTCTGVDQWVNSPTYDLAGAGVTSGQVRLRFQYTLGGGNAYAQDMGLDNIHIWGVDAGPTVSSTTPSNGATDQAIDGDVTIDFSANMDCGTINTTNITIDGGGLALASCSGSPTTAVFNTSGQVENTTYTVTVSTAVQDGGGVPLAAPYNFSYTTLGNPPTVQSTSPSNGAINTQLDGDVTITWNEPIDCATVDATTITIDAGGWALGSCAGSSATFNTSGQSLNTTYTVTVSTAVQDMNGVAMAALYLFSYTTQATLGPNYQVTSCSDCHDNPPLDAGSRDPLTGAFPGSHGAHTAGATITLACTDCHIDNGIPASAYPQGLAHREGLVEMAGTIFGGSYNKGTSFNQVNVSTLDSCSSTSCHGTSSPSWGTAGPLACDSCHGSSGHNEPRVAGEEVRNASAVGAHDTHMTGTSSLINGGVLCEDCHVEPVDVSSAGHFEATGNAEVPFPDLPIGVPPYNDNPARYNSTVPSYGATCSVYCHGANMPFGSTDGTNRTPAWSDTLTGCDTCHGTPPSTPSHGSVAQNDWAACMNCHTDTVTSTTPTVDPQFHLDGNAQGGDCISCHSTQRGNRAVVIDHFNANSHHIQGVTLTKQHCSACHWEANTDGTPNPTYHTQTTGQPVDLVTNWGGGTTRPSTYSGNNVQYMADGSRAEIAKITTHCLGCHDSNSASANPFGDGKTPTTYAWNTGESIGDRYSQGGSTTYGKYTSYANARQQNISKAYSAHGNASANVQGWSTSTGVDGTIPDRTGTTNVECFDCHNSHGSTVSGTSTSYTAGSGVTNGGILKDVTNGLGGYSANYKPADFAGSSTMVAHSAGAGLCFDCHMTQNASTSQPWGYSTFGASDMIIGYFEKVGWAGAAGVNSAGAQQRYTYKDNVAAAGGHFGASSSLNTTPTMMINGLCTPCHDPHGVSPTLDQQYAVPLLKGTWVTSPYQEDAAPANTNEQRGGGSRHSNTQRMQASSTPGYHIDQNTFAPPEYTLTTNVAAPNWEFYNLSSDSRKVSQSADVFGGLCLNCHQATDINPTTTATSGNWGGGGTGRYDRIHNAVQGWASSSGSNANNSMHGYTCSKCHTAHNSCLPRLMITNCLDTNHRGRVANGGPSGATHAFNNNTGGGQGRFPGGGGGYGDRPSGGTSTEWPNASGRGYFMQDGGTSGSHQPAFITCHDGTNANNGTYTNQDWNSVTPW